MSEPLKAVGEAGTYPQFDNRKRGAFGLIAMAASLRISNYLGRNESDLIRVAASHRRPILCSLLLHGTVYFTSQRIASSARTTAHKV